MPEGNGKISRGSKFKSIPEIIQRLPKGYAVPIYRLDDDKTLTAYNEPRNFFVKSERDILQQNLAGAQNFDPAAFLVLKAV